MAVITYRPRLWHLFVVALLGVAYAGVLYLVLHPRVADDYYDYYISRTASCFPRVTTGYYPWGRPVTFVPGRNGYKRDTLRSCGFMTPNNTGIRSFGDYGILKIRNPPPPGDLLFTFSSWANTDTSKPKREVQVVVNGEQIGVLTFATAKRVDGRMIIPARVALLNPKGMEIKFLVPRIGPAGTNSEPVTLQLRLEAMRIVALSEKQEAGDDPASQSSTKTWRVTSSPRR